MKMSPFKFKLSVNETAQYCAVFFMAILFSIFSAYAVYSGLYEFIVFLVVCGFFMVAFFYIKIAKAKINSPLAFVGVALFFLMPLVYTMTGIGVTPVIQVYIIVVGVFFIKSLFVFIKKDNIIKLSFCFYALYVGFLVLSTLVPVAHDITLASVMYQLVSDVKPYIVLAFALGVYGLYGQQTNKILHRIGTWLWLPMMILVALQLLAPSVYSVIFPYATMAKEENGILPYRGSAFFENSSYMVTVSSFFLIYYFSLGVTSNGFTRVKLIAISLGYLLLVFSAVQRQELAAAFISVVTVYVFYKNEYTLARCGISVVAVMIGVCLFFTIFGSMTEKEADTWGGNRYTAISHPRANLYDGAFKNAVENFPLGTGIGTYAGAGSSKFNLDLYYKLGFGHLWWFGKNKIDYLMDSYWANPVSEAGALGAIFLFMHYVLFCYAIFIRLRKDNSSHRPYYLIALSSLLYVLLTSFTSPSFIEPRIIFLPFMAIAFAYTNKHEYLK